MGEEPDPRDPNKRVKVFGDYRWQSYKDVQQRAQNIAKGVMKLELITETSGDAKPWRNDDTTWRFIGIWAKNRAEWMITHISNMYYSHTTIGFFDSMGPEQVDFIVN